MLDEPLWPIAPLEVSRCEQDEAAGIVRANVCDDLLLQLLRTRRELCSLLHALPVDDTAFAAEIAWPFMYRKEPSTDRIVLIDIYDQRQPLNRAKRWPAITMIRV